MTVSLGLSGVGFGLGALGAPKGLATDTPLFQISFFPDFMQVNLLFPRLSDIPAFGHEAPALGAANDAVGVIKAKIIRKIVSSAFRLINQRYLAIRHLSTNHINSVLVNTDEVEILFFPDIFIAIR